MFTLIIQRPGQDETRKPVEDEATGRAAWQTAIGTGELAEATLRGPDGHVVCWWSSESFIDDTAAHRDELVALCAQLTAEAPEGFDAGVARSPTGATMVTFTGPTRRYCTHTLGVSQASVITHWRGFVGPVATAADLVDGEVVDGDVVDDVASRLAHVAQAFREALSELPCDACTGPGCILCGGAGVGLDSRWRSLAEGRLSAEAESALREEAGKTERGKLLLSVYDPFTEAEKARIFESVRGLMRRRARGYAAIIAEIEAAADRCPEPGATESWTLKAHLEAKRACLGGHTPADPAARSLARDLLVLSAGAALRAVRHIDDEMAAEHLARRPG